MNYSCYSTDLQVSRQSTICYSRPTRDDGDDGTGSERSQVGDPAPITVFLKLYALLSA